MSPIIRLMFLVLLIGFLFSSCQKELSYQPDGTATAAVFTINCITPVIIGTFVQGTPLTSTNIVTLSANVTVPGTYHITQTFNGITFTAIGTFVSKGAAEPVTLTCSGTPTVAGQNNITLGANICTFIIDVMPINPNGDFFIATLGGVTKSFNTNLTGILHNVINGSSDLLINGFRNTTGSEKMTINFLNSGNTIGTGSYNNIFPLFGNPCAVATYIDSTGAPWESINGTFTITSLSSLTATGSFFGLLTKLNTGGAPIRLTITSGIFTVTL